MIQRILLPAITVLLLLQTACKKDNFKEPGSILSGKVLYQGQPVNVRSNGVQLELWQHGYALFSKIAVFVGEDGSFSARLTDGDYKLVRLPGNGPWTDNADSIEVHVHGSVTVDVPVNPYFLVANASVQKAAATTVSATFDVQGVDNSKSLDYAALFIGQTTIVDNVNNSAVVLKSAADLGGNLKGVQLSAAIPASLAGRDYIYARIGIKTAGVAELVFGEPVKIALK